MRVTTLALLVICIQLSVFAKGQDRITVVVRNTEWPKALAAVQKASDYRFVYSNDVAPVNRKIDLVVRDADLPEVMDKLLASTTLSYKVMPDKLVVLYSKLNNSPEIKVSGRISDENGAPLPGASVRVKGTSQGVSANSNGEFSITVPDDAVLIFSFVGYEERQVSVSGQATINVSLKPSVKVQDQVVVIGYGTATKRDLTGSIVKIPGKDVADKPNTNPVASLQGKVAGLSVVNSGTPGQQPDIRIRGTNSISSEGVRPLFVVDGIFNDNIDYLNPNDIESMEILKDPSSLAIFGVRGANGVIAITTKKAKAGQLIINLNSSFGTKKLVDKIKMVDAEGFKTLFTEEQVNIGVPANQMFDFSKWPGNTDWVDAVTQTGTFNTNNLSITGSTEKNRFYMGVGYTGEEGIVRHEKLEKILLSISDELRVNKAIKIGFTLNGFRQKLPYSRAQGILFDARRVLPITPVFNDARNAYYDLAIQSAQITNPMMVLENNWDKELRYENRLVGSVYAEINFLKYFNLRTTLYGDMANLDGRTYRPIDSVYNPIIDQVFIHPSYNRTTVSQSNQRWNKFQQDHILTFRKNFGDHGLTATAGFTTYYQEYRGLFASVKQSLTGLPIPDDKRFWYIDNGFGDPATRESSSSQSEEATVSGLFRVLYNFKSKYFLNGSYRTDASSTISPFNRTKSFYSVGAAWEITREDFMSSQNIFDFLKVKASWGILGGRNTAGLAYPFYPELLTGSTAVFGSIIVPAYGLAYEPDRDLTWETVDGKEGGIEFEVLQKRLHGEIVYYHKITRDLLAFENLGNNRRRLANLGNVRNKGFEISATWSDNINRNLSYSISGNLTTLDNKVTKFPSGAKLNASEERPNQTELNYPIGYFYGYVVEGIFQTYAEKLGSAVMNLGNSYGPGDLKYKDINGDGVVDASDRTIIGNPTPDFMYGGSISLNYKGRLDFSVDFNGVYGNEVYRYWGSSELPFTKFNYPAFKLNRWHGEGTSNWDPILGDNHTTNRLPSTYGIEDGSYFRLRNIQLGYTFNPKLIEKAHLKSLRLFANVQNLKTFKNNSGYTPEFGGSPTSFGIDNGNGAIPLVFTGGINVSF